VNRVYSAIALADFRERSRRTRFWAVLAIVAALTWWCFPPLDAGYMTVGFGDGYRGRYSSAWVGMVLALMCSMILSWLGFYVVRGTVSRDFDTRVWQLLATTPMSRVGYLVAKWASHMAVFCLILALGLCIALAAQAWRGEDREFRIWEAAKPVLLLALPALAWSGFFAVLFDLLPWLRRTTGNVLFFLVWLFGMSLMGVAIGLPQLRLSDPFGIAVFMREITQPMAITAPHVDVAEFNIGLSQVEVGTRVFEWRQWRPSTALLQERLMWFLAPVLLLLPLAWALDWAAARTLPPQETRGNDAGLQLRWLDRLLHLLGGGPQANLMAAELRLLLRPRHRRWWLAIGAMWIAQTVVPGQGITIASIIAWLLCLDIFSRSALRERETGSAALVFTASRARGRILIGRLISNWLLAVAVALPALIRLAAIQPEAALALLGIAVALPVLGFALAALTGNSRLFELAFVSVAYIGVQGQPTSLLLSAPEQILAVGLVVMAAAVLLLALCWPRLSEHAS
jgi:hypothetical protein